MNDRLFVTYPPSLSDEIRAEAERLNRSAAWVTQYAWKIARAKISQLPTCYTKEAEK